MDKNEKVTLKTIAEKTGYSVNTVSRALRGKDDIAPQTQKKIQDLANSMGYVNNMMASSLRLGYTKTIAVILGDISNPHFAIIMKEIEERARAYSYSSFLINTNENEELELQAIKDAINKNVDGIILCPVQKSEKNIHFLNSKNIPYVLIGRYFDQLDNDFVICNDELGAYQATKHLLDKGHKKIAFFNAPLYISSARERLSGYIKAHEECRLPIKHSLIHELPICPGEEETGIREIFEKSSDFTAIFAFNDIIAWKIWAFLQESGYSVPEHYSIIGFDHIQSKLSFPYHLSTISSHKTKMSTKAVDLLVKRMQNKELVEERENIILDTLLVEGDTVSICDL